tara:strand:- start:8169 stop:8366 length:198 start_codon:yes stop_codon:yes gene_type:complete
MNKLIQELTVQDFLLTIVLVLISVRIAPFMTLGALLISTDNEVVGLLFVLSGVFHMIFKIANWDS